VWGAGGEAISQSSLAERRKIAALLAQKAGSSDPIQHWTQGLARVSDGIMAGLEAREIKAEEEKARASENEAWDTFGGAYRSGAAAASPTGGAPTPTEAPFKTSIGPSVRDPEGPTGDDFRSANAMGGLDPKDVDLAVRTVLAEAGNQGPEGMAAVAAVLRNRANGAGSTIGAEALKPNQFEPWNPGSGNDPRRFDPKSPEYQAAYKTILPVLTGQADDPTGGATHFYAPAAQAKLGRSKPDWDNGTGRDLGGHRFFNLPYGGGGKHGTEPKGVQVASADPRFVPGAPAPVAPVAPATPATPATPVQRVAQAMPAQAAPAPSNRQAVIDALHEQGRRNPALRKQLGAQIQQLAEQDKEERKAALEAQRFQATHGLAQESARRAAESAEREKVKEARAAEEAPVKEASGYRAEVMKLPSYKKVTEALPVFKSMTEAMQYDDQAADINIIYGMAKIMDPESVVREKEGEAIQRTDGVFGQLASLANGVKGGAKLSPEVRASLIREAESRLRSYKGVFDTETDGFFGGIVDRRKLNRDDVIPKYEIPAWDKAKIGTIGRDGQPLKKDPKAVPAPALVGTAQAAPAAPVMQGPPGMPLPAAPAQAAPPPAGVDPKIWAVMTPQERALWK
jgi:hypothetical protein